MIEATRGVIDIGSNAARLVVYSGAARAPVPIYNEKLPVSLGKSLLASGGFTEPVIAQTLAGLVRFKALAEMMEVENLRVVGTAALRDAYNGQELVERAGKAGIVIEVLRGDSEAVAAGLGVLSDAPEADGYAADLGGGSLELVRIRDGDIHNRISLPLGTTRLPGLADPARMILAAIAQSEDFDLEKGLQLYLVGGVWRAAAKLDQAMQAYPFRIVGNHEIAAERLAVLAKTAADKPRLKAMREVPVGRVDALYEAIRLLQQLVTLFEPSRILTSACGIREGLLFDALSASERLKDPLIACTAHEGRRLSRPAFDGNELERWMAPLFEGESETDQRLRHAVCLLADTSWSSHPDHRAVHALETGLYGNWIGVDLPGRVIVARALFAAHGGKASEWPNLAQIVSTEQLGQADAWGLAIRLAMRLGGGAARSLRQSEIARDGKYCVLTMPELLDPEAIERRLGNLANFLGLEPKLELA
jgi:exopolyphosphatase / guanosine-5'-triphosphate,3'-diphosphate pyrophosphatase